MARTAVWWLGRTLAKGVRYLGYGAGSLLLFLFTLGPVAWLATLDPSGLWLVPYLTLVGVFMAYLVWLISTTKGRSKLEEPGDGLINQIRYFLPTWVAVSLFFLGLTFFGTVTLALHENNLTPTDPENEVNVALLQDYYLWQAADFVPLMEITETMKWEPDVEYTGSWVGFWVVLFRGSVIIPILLLIGFYRQRAPDGKVSDEALPESAA